MLRFKSQGYALSAIASLALSFWCPLFAGAPKKSAGPGMRMVMPLVAPLFIEDQDHECVLRMVNELKATVHATVVAKTPEGFAIAQQPGQQAGNLSQQITVNPRNFHTQSPPATSVPNGQLVVNGVNYTLPVPPEPGGANIDFSGLGMFGHQENYSGQSVTTIQSGPNAGYSYFGSNLSFTTLFFHYIINPDLVNQSSTFSKEQCGVKGYITWANLIAQTQRHEYNSSTQSHYGFYTASMNANNPGDFLEQQVAIPGTNLTQFSNNVASGLQSRLSNIASGTSVEPCAVNEDSSCRFLGNINYAPYGSCN